MGEYTRDAFDPEPFDLDAQHDRYPSDGFIPLSSAHDARAVTTGGGARTPPPFDAAGWIADTAPDLLPMLRGIRPDFAELVESIAYAAYMHGRNEHQRFVNDRVDELMRARFGE